MQKVIFNYSVQERDDFRLFYGSFTVGKRVRGQNFGSKIFPCTKKKLSLAGRCTPFQLSN